jgi:hypothetical protein
MRHFGRLPGPIRWWFSFFATAFLASGGAHAAVPVTNYLVVQPIDVCGTTGPSSPTGCAPFNTSSKSPNPSTATLTTPIGFVDPTTNINITRAIWLQAGIDVSFLPMLEYNNSTYQSIDVYQDSTTGQLGSNAFKQLTTSPGPAAASGCVSNCLVPIYSTSTYTYPYANANAIPMFFINSIIPKSPLTGTYYGFGWVNGVGLALSAATISFSQFVPSHFDTLAHEIGHNLGLDHCTYGAGAAFGSAASPCTAPPAVACSGTLPNPGGCNVMDAGTIRIVPASTGCTAQSSSTTSNGGALYDLDTGLYLSAAVCPAPANPIADQLIPGSGVQQGQALKSGFLNTQPNVSAIAGGGTGDLPFSVTNSNPLNCTDSRCYIASLIIATPEGYNFVGYQFQYVSGPKPKTTAVLKGNTGNGNQNCQKSLPIGSNPTFQCLEIDFPVTVGPNGNYISNFGPGVIFNFNANIHNETTGQTATIAQLGCSAPTPGGCLDLTEVFVNLFATTSVFDQSGNASSQFPDPTTGPVIVSPATFPTLAKLNPPPTFTGSPNPVTGGPPAPCTPNGDGSCPDLAGGDPNGGD